MRHRASRLTLMSTWVLMVAAAVGAVPARAATLGMTFNYNTNAGTYDKAKVLNASQGGYVAIQNLNFLPEQYDRYAEAGRSAPSTRQPGSVGPVKPITAALS